VAVVGDQTSEEVATGMAEAEAAGMVTETPVVEMISEGEVAALEVT
jgi:hypothetical protein